MKRNTIILRVQILITIVGMGSPILAMLIATKGEHYALACTICLISPLWLYALEQYKK
jgi:hypothetical protein